MLTFRKSRVLGRVGRCRSGCKALIGQRLQTVRGALVVRDATGIVTLRCQEASGRREEIWLGHRGQTGLTPVPTNFVDTR